MIFSGKLKTIKHVLIFERNNLKYVLFPKNLNKIKQENDIFIKIFQDFKINNLSYRDLVIKINTTLSKENILTENFKDYEKDLNFCIFNKTYDILNVDKKAKLLYENNLFKKIIIDILNSNINISAFYKIVELNLFDKPYYKTKYNYNLNISPLLHYIYLGYLENKQPNLEFDGQFYKTFNKNVSKSNLNPLVYLVLKGLDEGIVKINNNAWQPKSINRITTKKQINNFYEYGLNNNSHEKKIIISMTSYIKRINDVIYTVYSLLNQELKPDKLILWLSYEEFPNKEKDLPHDLLNLKKNGLTIKWCSNIKSYKKLIPTIKEYPNDIIITADDDIYYPINWLKELYNSYKKHPNDIIAHRSRRISFDKNNNLNKYDSWMLIKNEVDSSFLNFFTTGGGVLFPPNSLNDQVINFKLASSICPYADDIWFWGMAILNKTKSRVVKNNIHRLTYVNPGRDALFSKDTLWSYNEKHNIEQFNNLLNEFPEIKKTIYELSKIQEEDKLNELT